MNTYESVMANIHALQNGDQNAFRSSYSRWYAFGMDATLRMALAYGGKNGVESAIEYASVNSGLRAGPGDILCSLREAEKRKIGRVSTYESLWVWYYALYLSFLSESEKKKLKFSYAMGVTCIVKFLKMRWYLWGGK